MTLPTSTDDETTPKTSSLGMGLNGISDWSPQLPFIDLMKQSRDWQDWYNGVEGFTVDEDDWVLALQEGQTAGTVFYTPPDEESMPFTRVVVFYEGEGTLVYSWSARKVVDESTPGRDVITVGANANLVRITELNVTNPLRNIRMIPEPYLDDYEAGAIFNPRFVERISQFNTLRFMDWMETNSEPAHVWEERNRPESRTWNEGGVPLEVMIELANAVNANPWFCIPHLANETYITNFAAMVEDQLSPNLIAYVEHSNEVWNWGFAQAQYANVKGRERWGDVGNAFMQWHGMRTAVICDGFKLGAFASNPERIKCVLGVQTAYHGLQPGAVECPLWAAEGNAPCYQHGFDYLAVTTYFDGGLNGPFNGESNAAEHEAALRGLFNDTDGGIDRAFVQLTNGTVLNDMEEYADYEGVVWKIGSELAYWSEYVAEFGLGLVAYEGGQHITANGLVLQNDEDVIDFHLAINRDARMKGMYKDVFQTWQAAGGAVHMCFVDISTPGKYGSWGALEYLEQETSPKWAAITEFNEDVACWWDGCDISVSSS